MRQLLPFALILGLAACDKAAEAPTDAAPAAEAAVEPAEAMPAPAETAALPPPAADGQGAGEITQVSPPPGLAPVPSTVPGPQPIPVPDDQAMKPVTTTDPAKQ
ncbi:MAG: hypothetical protein JNM58_19395 [Xanthomonadaceae bacterium]|nr:hypothetical protein [Xanthomonadaceae bacterium]